MIFQSILIFLMFFFEKYECFEEKKYFLKKIFFRKLLEFFFEKYDFLKKYDDFFLKNIKIFFEKYKVFF